MESHGSVLIPVMAFSAHMPNSTLFQLNHKTFNLSFEIHDIQHFIFLLGPISLIVSLLLF